MKPVFDAIAACLRYPDPGVEEVIWAAAKLVRESSAETTRHEMASAIETLARWLEETPRGETEERYARLFDLSPICTLNLGYHLFGESYERGALLAGLSAELAARGLEPGDEIPDHLTHLLRLLGRMNEPEDQSLLLGQILLPGLGVVNRELKESSDPWSRILGMLPSYLQDLATSEGLEFEVASVPPKRLPIVDGGLPYPGASHA